MNFAKMNFQKPFYTACSFLTGVFTLIFFFSMIFGSAVSLAMGIILVVPTSTIYFDGSVPLGIVLIVFSFSVIPFLSYLGLLGCLGLTNVCMEKENESRSEV
jgi:hypothetical protein